MTCFPSLQIIRDHLGNDILVCQTSRFLICKEETSLNPVAIEELWLHKLPSTNQMSWMYLTYRLKITQPPAKNPNDNL